jgi:hypothetical protein
LWITLNRWGEINGLNEPKFWHRFVSKTGDGDILPQKVRLTSQLWSFNDSKIFVTDWRRSEVSLAFRQGIDAFDDPELTGLGSLAKFAVIYELSLR